jgi:hypothetical protein
MLSKLEGRELMQRDGNMQLGDLMISIQLLSQENQTWITLHYRDSVTRYFASGFFHELPFPKPLIITLGSFQIFFENLRRYLQVNDTGGKFCHQFPLCC